MEVEIFPLFPENIYKSIMDGNASESPIKKEISVVLDDSESKAMWHCR